jgi:FAD:protein FMN transferase
MEMSRDTNGLFDPAIGPLIALWGFGSKSEAGRVPSADEIAAVLPLLDPAGIEIDAARKSVRLKLARMSIDLNGIAQGFASEKAEDILRKMGVGSALVESGGGEFVAIGSKPGDEPFRIGIRKPRRESPDLIGYFEMTDNSLATSGDYEKYFEVGGKRYSHLMDPRTGMPKSGEPTSVTVIGKSCTKCDALATVAAILSPEEAKRVVAAFPGYQVIIASETPDGPKFTFSDGLVQNGDAFALRSNARKNGK